MRETSSARQQRPLGWAFGHRAVASSARDVLMRDRTTDRRRRPSAPIAQPWPRAASERPADAAALQCSMPTRQVLAQMAASSGLGFGVAAALASVSASPLGAFLAAGAGLAYAWVLVSRTVHPASDAAAVHHWPPADDDGLAVAPPRLINEESLWARLAENEGFATTPH